jgi:hypothetical protein
MSEEAIVWEEDIDRLDYVREVWATAYSRRRPVPWHGEGRRVGYSVLRADSPNTGQPGTFKRRVFFLKDHDRDSEPEGVYGTPDAPCEAVDPRLVMVGDSPRSRKGREV